MKYKAGVSYITIIGKNDIKIRQREREDRDRVWQTDRQRGSMVWSRHIDIGNRDGERERERELKII